MAAARNDPLAELFISVTGQSSVTDTQRRDGPRIADRDEQAVGDYVRATARANGLTDALAEPDAE